MNKKKILLLNPPYKKIVIRDYYCSQQPELEYYWPPIDLYVLYAILHFKFDIHYIDAIKLNISAKTIIEYIKNKTIDIIIALTGAISYKEDLYFFEKIKKQNYNTKIILIADFLQNVILKDFYIRYPFIDGIIKDFTNQEILFELDKSGQDKILIDYKPEKFSYKIAYEQINLLKGYYMPMGLYPEIPPVLTTFGCRNSCSFCPYSVIKYKERNIDNLIEELLVYKKFKIKEIMFRDTHFGGNCERIKLILNEFIKNKLDFKYSVELKIDEIDEEAIELLKRTGCHMVLIGIENHDIELLKKYKKNIDIKKEITNIKLLKKYDITILGHIILGFPGTDIRHWKKTVEFIKRINLDFVIFSSLELPFGTEIRETQQINKQDIYANEYEYIKPEHDELSEFIKREYIKFYFNIKKIKIILKIKTFFQLYTYIKNLFFLIIKIIKK